MISPFPVTALCSGLRAGQLPCLHDIVERETGIRQLIQEILLLPRPHLPDRAGISDSRPSKRTGRNGAPTMLVMPARSKAWGTREKRRPDHLSLIALPAESPTSRKELFSPMTFFTGCPKTSLTLRSSAKRAGEKDALENDGRARATSEVCGGGVSAREDAGGVVPGVRDLASGGV